MNDSYIIPLLIAVSTLITLLLFFITLFILVNKNKHRRLQQEKIELRYKYEKELLTTRLEVQEQSLNIVSQEIHDNICQVLGHVKHNLYAIEYNLFPDGNEDLLKTSTSLVGKTIDDLRNISHVLNPVYIQKIGLEDAIKKELEYLRAFYKIELNLVLDGDPPDFAAETEIIIFRIVQETLSNIVKHSSATIVDLLVHYTPTQMTVTIADNGTGFDLENIRSKNSGIGLINMTQRAKLINGIFDIRSGINQGTTVVLKVSY